MKKFLIVLLVSTIFSIGMVGQSFVEVNTTITNPGKFSQITSKSFIYSNGSGNLKNDIYSFFDPQIDLDINSYDPSSDPTTTYLLIIYQEGSVLNSTFVFDETLDSENNPFIFGHSNEIIAIAQYSRVGSEKQIMLYNNREVTKWYLNHEEKSITEVVSQTGRIDLDN